MSPETVARAGMALYGASWRAELARALGVSDRTLRRWLAGEHPVPEGVGADILRLLAARDEASLDAQAAIHAERALSIARQALAETGARPDVIRLASSEGLSPALLERVAAKLRAAGWAAEVAA